MVNQAKTIKISQIFGNLIMSNKSDGEADLMNELFHLNRIFSDPSGCSHSALTPPEVFQRGKIIEWFHHHWQEGVR